MDASEKIMLFVSQALSDLPLLALAIAGATICGSKLARTHDNAFKWSLAGFATLGVRSVVLPLLQFRMTLAIAAGAAPEDVATGYALLALTAQLSMLLGVAFLLVAILSSRAIQLEP